MWVGATHHCSHLATIGWGPAPELVQHSGVGDFDGVVVEPVQKIAFSLLDCLFVDGARALIVVTCVHSKLQIWPVLTAYGQPAVQCAIWLHRQPSCSPASPNRPQHTTAPIRVGCLRLLLRCQPNIPSQPAAAAQDTVWCTAETCLAAHFH